MSSTRKTYLTYGLMLVLTLWPALHLVLVKSYGLSPWKLAGWGMYSAPQFDNVGMEIYGRGAADADFEQLRAPSSELREQANEFLASYRWLRGLAGSNELAEMVFAQNSQWQQIRIEIHQAHMDRHTGMVSKTPVVREHSRKNLP